jgi:hypothetical protein
MSDTPNINEESRSALAALAQGMSEPAPESDPNSLDFLNSQLDSDIPDIPPEQAVPEEDLLDLSKSHPNVTFKESVFKPLPAGATPEAYLRLPSLDEEEVSKLTMAIRGIRFTRPETAAWGQHLMDSVAYLTRGKQFAGTLLREGSDFIQVPTFEGQPLDIGVPPAPSAKGMTLRGEEALTANARIMGNYGRIQIPLWNSGVWLTIRVAQNDELHTLDQQLAAHTYDLGYMSNGLVYSNTSVLYNSIMIDFILERCTGSNLKDHSVENLKKAIRIPDLYPLVARYAAAIFPQGFPYGRPCPGGPIKCDNIEKEILRLSKIVVTDMSVLKPEQLKHMSTRTVGGKYSLADLDKYRGYFTHYGDRQIPLRAGQIEAILSPPSLEAYIASGEVWVNGIISQATGLLIDASTQEIEDYVNQQYLLATMRQYSHWVTKVVYPADNNVVDDQDTLEKVLADLSNDSAVADAFIRAISKYIDDCTVSVVVIPRGKCSKCGQMHGSGDGHPYVIPIDPVHAFFVLRDLRIRSILSVFTGH